MEERGLGSWREQRNGEGQIDGDRSRGNKYRAELGRPRRAARARGKSEEQWGKGTAGSRPAAARWVGAQGWVQSHELLLSGWPWCQLPCRAAAPSPPPPPLLLDGGVFGLLPGQLLEEQTEGGLGCGAGERRSVGKGESFGESY